MNCPHCHCPVGNDQYHVGDWEPVYDDRGNITDSRRGISLSCDHCGLFQIEQDAHHRVRYAHGPYTNDKDVRRVAKRIPAESRVKRIKVAVA